ncbi:hypothetical protein BDW02DRAFT_585092 [Decorospora gaudefroyi]|uniref:HD/PDEase domain-containing protein n=1 Tax=Decorospora gaudefroyi TaxID=184978 RepID=A0A6A5KWR0_9PLEO|nr:hypothetical protein BDW02DRAFT_585092 [Decorospora gaudefroyi]
MCPPSDLAEKTTTQPILDTSSIVPPTAISEAAYAYASKLLHPSVLNHSVRVYLYVKALAEHKSSRYSSDPVQHDLLFTACLFHDIGTTENHNGPQRFEVEGADAAIQHLSHFSVSATDAYEVWTAIAIGELSKIVRIAVMTDFGRKSSEWDMLAPLREKLEAQFERAEIEKVLGDAVVEQTMRRPEKAPKVSWPNAMYTASLAEPEWQGVNKAF